MSSTTTNYSFTIAAQNENYDIDVQNNNWTTVDTSLKAISDAAAAAQTTANEAKAAGAATDSVIGSRTADPTQVPNGFVGTLTQWLSWITNRIKAITGTTNWYDAPPTTLTAANNHIGNTNNPHGVTAAQVGAVATTSLGQTNGVATLGADSKLTAAQVPIASANTLGGVKQGTNTTIAADGTISVAGTMAKTDASQTWSAAQTFTADVTIKNGVGVLYFDTSRTNKSYIRWNASSTTDLGMDFQVDGTIVLNLDSTGGAKLTGAMKQVKGVATQGTFGVATEVRSVSDLQLTTISATNILVYSSPLAGNYELNTYLRATSACNVTLSISYTDAGGNVTQTLYSNQALNTGDRFSILPYFFNATATGTITVTVTASVANALFISATLEGK